MATESRRSFLAALASVPLVAGASRLEARASTPAQAASAHDADAEVFAAARRQFLMPVDVTYCNTGTLGATPRERGRCA